MAPKEIVSKMMEGDAFSRWLGIKVEAVELGSCELKMTITQEMVNGFNIAHGGILYSFSDSCLAFAANSYGQKAVSIETSISHTRPSATGDILIAKAKELNRTKNIGIYEVIVTNQKGKVVSLFKGTVFIKSADYWK